MVIIYLSAGITSKDSSEDDKKATLRVINEENSFLNNSVMILTYALMNGEKCFCISSGWKFPFVVQLFYWAHPNVIPHLIGSSSLMGFGWCNPEAASRCSLFGMWNYMPPLYAYISQCSCSGYKVLLLKLPSGNQAKLNLITIATVNLPDTACVSWCSKRAFISVMSQRQM